MKAMKQSIDDSANEAEKGIIGLNAGVLRNAGMSPEEAQKQAEISTQLAAQGGMMAGSIGDVAGKAANTAGRIFRGVGERAPTANRAAKAANLMDTMNMGKSMANPEIIGLAGKTPLDRLGNLPNEAKAAVLKRIQELGLADKLGKLGK